MAIAQVTNGVTNGSGSSLTLSLTVSGSNTILWAGGFMGSGASPITALTYNGDALTHVTGSPFASGGQFQYLAYLINPDAGTHDLAVTFTSSDNVTLHGVVYSGAKQSGVPDATNTSDIGVTTTPSQAVTTVADNAWAVWMLRGESGNTVTAGANTTLVNQYGPFDEHMLEGGPKTPAGSLTLNANATSSHHYGIIASFAPVPAGPASFGTWNGAATSTLTDINGQTIAGMSSWNGMT